jgi:inosose dehydratase
MTYTEAVAAGMYVPLGAGDVDIAGIVKTLGDNGYDGWYVMEQDNILEADPSDVGDQGPLADVLASVDFLKGVKSPA